MCLGVICIVGRVGQNRIYTPYMAVYLVISLPKILYINRIYMVLANPNCRLVIARRKHISANQKMYTWSVS
jgi:hypothetical protein